MKQRLTNLTTAAMCGGMICGNVRNIIYAAGRYCAIVPAEWPEIGKQITIQCNMLIREKL